MLMLSHIIYSQANTLPIIRDLYHPPEKITIDDYDKKKELLSNLYDKTEIELYRPIANNIPAIEAISTKSKVSNYKNHAEIIFGKEKYNFSITIYVNDKDKIRQMFISLKTAPIATQGATDTYIIRVLNSKFSRTFLHVVEFYSEKKCYFDHIGLSGLSFLVDDIEEKEGQIKQLGFRSTGVYHAAPIDFNVCLLYDYNSAVVELMQIRR